MNVKTEVRGQRSEVRRRADGRAVFLLPTAYCLLPTVLLLLIFPAHARAAQTPVRVAVLDFGETEAGRRAAERVAASLVASPKDVDTSVARVGGRTAAVLSLVDRDLSRAAARGAAYEGSLNLTLREARDLGAAVGCDFLVIGDAQVLRRSSSAAPVYFEAYASVFLVSARTGRLVAWQRPSVEAASAEAASARLLGELDALGLRLAAHVSEAREREARERIAAVSQAEAEVFEDLSNDDGANVRGTLRAPEPFRRLRPPYPDTAARAEAEATVDVLVNINAAGKVGRVEVTRWAGFGLDEAVVETVRRMHFRPATRDGAPFAARVLLRYNFRRPPKASQQAQQQN
ncbi:MAG TPA: TonB family protein [Pyrinomonadaceae bacterium]|nr:TonB family protein [Pyrinomonadaceae bacterium]